MDSGCGISPDGEDGLDGIADVVMEIHRFGVLIPVVPCLLYSSRMFDGASIRRVSSLQKKSILHLKTHSILESILRRLEKLTVFL